MIRDEVLGSFRDKKVLVTGGTGLIGRQVVHLLSAAGARVRIVSLDRIRVPAHVDHFYADLTSFESCKELSRDIEYVFHLAGIKGSIEVTKSKPASFFVPLLMMNTNLLEACRLNQVQRVVFASSIGAYPSAEVFKETDAEDEGPPMDMFPGWAKRMAELQVKAYRIQYGLTNFAIVRPCNVYGPGDNFDPANAMVIPSLMYRIRRGDDPVEIWGDGSAIRDFAYCADVAEGVILAMYHGTGPSYVNLGSGQACSIRELVETLRSVMPFNYRFDAARPSGFPRRVMDISRARDLLGYNPSTTLRDGLKKTWDWYVNHHDEHLQKHNYLAG